MSQVLNERVDLPVLISGFKLLPLLFCWYGRAWRASGGGVLGPFRLGLSEESIII